MTQQHHSVIVGQVGAGKTTTTAELLQAWATGHPGGTVSTAAAGVHDAMRRLDLFDLPEIKLPKEGGGK